MGGRYPYLLLSRTCLLALLSLFFSFLGCWKLFEVFREIYPHLEKQIAIATLFIPSVFFWGAAGLMKDPVMIACIGFFVWGAYYGGIKRQNLIKSILYVLVSIYFISIIKAYIVIALVPATMVWFFLHYRKKIKNKTTKMLLGPIFLLLGGFMGFLVLQKLSSSLDDRFSQDQILKYAINMQQYHARETKEHDGTGYDLGEIDPSLSGVIKTIPKAVNVALFRPYAWGSQESHFNTKRLGVLDFFGIYFVHFFQSGHLENH